MSSSWWCSRCGREMGPLNQKCFCRQPPEWGERIDDDSAVAKLKARVAELEAVLEEGKMTVLRGHYFKPDDQKDKDPQELKCVCGATLSLTDSEDSPRIRGLGWYLLKGPYICPINKEEHERREGGINVSE